MNRERRIEAKDILAAAATIMAGRMASDINTPRSVSYQIEDQFLTITSSVIKGATLIEERE